MKKLKNISTIIAALAVIIATSVGAHADEELVKKLETKYNSAKTYSAKFDQVVISSTYRTEVARGSGIVYFKSPGKMRWEYLEPEKHVVIIDGKFMWDYYESEKMVVKTDLEKALPGKTPKAFMFGMGNLSDDFLVTSYIRTNPDGTEVAEVVLGPKVDENGKKQDELGIGPILLMVDPKKMLVMKTEFEDFFGNSNNLRFDDIVLNKSLKDSLFDFQVPKGVQVVSGDKLSEIMQEELEKPKDGAKDDKDKGKEVP